MLIYSLCNSLSTQLAEKQNAIYHNIYNSIKDVPTKIWDKLVPTHRFFLQRPYLSVLENTHKDKIDFRYVVYYDNEEAVAVSVFQLIRVEGKENLRLNSTQKEIAQKNETDCKLSDIGKSVKSKVVNRIHRLSFRMLVAGNVFITGEHGFCYVPKFEHHAFESLNKAIDDVLAQEKAKNNEVTAVMVKDFYENALEKAKHLQQYSYQEIVAEPNMEMEIRPEWHTFDDYLASMLSKYRVRAKSFFKKGKHLVRKDLTLEEIAAHQERLHEMYVKIADSADINLAKVSVNYFTELKRTLGDDFNVRAYFLEEKLVGFISTFKAHHELEAHFVGYDEHYNRSHAIYANVLYDIVTIGIEQKVEKIVMGRTAPEIKSAVGAVGVHLNCFIRHKSYLKNQIIGLLVNQFRQDEWVQRSPFKEITASQSVNKQEKVAILVS